MGEMGDVFNEMRSATKLHHEKMLAKAHTEGWTKHTDYHFSHTFNNIRFDWWPSSPRKG